MDYGPSLKLGDIRRKRTNKTPESRRYICACQKSYMSYTSLWTHVKIKHKGIPPGRVVKPLKESAKKVKAANFYNPLQNYTPTQMDIYERQLFENPLEKFCTELTEKQNIKAFLRPNLKKFYMNEPFYQIYLNYEPEMQSPVYNEKLDLFEQTCDQALCQFLSGVINQLSYCFHWDVAFMFVLLFAKGIENKYNGDTEAIKKESAKNLSELPNMIYFKVLPEWRKLDWFSNLLIFKSDKLGRMVELFYAWLCTKKYIAMKVSMNHEHFD